MILLLIAVFFCIGQNHLMFEVKLMSIPSIFIYYMFKVNYKIEIEKYLIFLFCFIGDIYNLLEIKSFEMGAMVSFFTVYLILLYLVMNDFKKIKFQSTNLFPIILTFLLIGSFLIVIFNLNVIKISGIIGVYIIYGIVLGLLSFFSITLYISKSSFAYLNLVLMMTCFMVSDFFYFINHYYLPQNIFILIENETQVLTYFFMVKYFIENQDKLYSNQTYLNN